MTWDICMSDITKSRDLSTDVTNEERAYLDAIDRVVELEEEANLEYIRLTAAGVRTWEAWKQVELGHGANIARAKAQAEIALGRMHRASEPR